MTTHPATTRPTASAPSQRGFSFIEIVIVMGAMAVLMGLAVGLSGLTAWALHRFDTLRRAVVLPPIDDPAYGDALAEAQGRLTADALSATFLFTGCGGYLCLSYPDHLSRRDV